MNICRAQLFLLLALTLCATTFARAAETNSLVWQADRNQVSADIRGEALWPLLEDIAHQTGWHIFVEPGASHNASTKFRDLPAGEALRKLLGHLNYALVPRTNGPQELYVFTTTIHAATQRVAATLAKASPQKHVANELLVKLKPGADIDALAKKLGATVVARNDKLGLYRLKFEDAPTTDSALASLKTNPDVAAVDYNYIFDAPPAPQLVANPPATTTPALTLSDSAPNDPCSPVVGLIDTQVQSLGSQLDPILLKPISVVGDLPANTAATPTHGTAMANALAQALQQSSQGKTPVKILSVVVYDQSETTTSWNVALGIQAAVDGGATVLNMSLGGTTDSAIMDDIIKQALAKGIVIFAAAGNQPVSAPTYPAALAGVNDVTALSQPGQLAAYANFSPQVDMALPGTTVFNYAGQVFAVQGTSPATAYASGVAAGTKGINCLPWAQIQSAMQAKFPVPQK